MPRTCEICGGKHYAKNRCKLHYRMPSRTASLIEKCVEAVEEYNLAQVKIRGHIDNSRPKVGDIIETNEGTMRVVSIKPSLSRKDKSIPELLKLLEIVFNRFIRNRDRLPHSTFICIACGLRKMSGEMEAGHFFSKTFSFLRFNEDNVHGECHNCNCNNDHHLVGYEVHLKKKIGLERFNFLLDNYNKSHKWDRQELLDLIAKYK